MANTTQVDALEGEIVSAIATEGQLSVEVDALETELRTSDPKFQLFIEKQAELRQVQAKNAEIWKKIESDMIENNVKSIKGDWGYVTIADRTDYVVEDLTLLPAKFIKKVADNSKINSYIKLEGKLPKGVEEKHKQYLTKRIKAPKEGQE